MKETIGAFHLFRNSLLGLWAMSRPLVLVSNILSWLFGVSIAFGSGWSIELLSFGLGFSAMVLVSVSVHYVNEYADYQTDKLTSRTIYSGGSGVLPSGIVPRRLVLQAAVVALVFGVGIQLLASYFGIHSWLALAVIGIGALWGWMYSLLRLKLVWRGLGELDNSLLGANLLLVYGYIVLSKRFDVWVILTCLPFTLLAFNNLLAVTWVDREADSKVGKRTLATRWPVGRLRILYGLVATASFSLLLLSSNWMTPVEVAIAGLAALPLAIWGLKTYTQNEISHASVYAMVMMMLVQTIVWFMIGMRV